MAKQFSELPGAGRLYVAGVIGLGSIAILYSSASLILFPVEPEWIVVAALTLLTGSFSIKIPSVSARLSVSETFVFVAVLLFGQHVGTILVALDSLILTSWLRHPSRSSLRAMFNMAAGALAIFSASQLFVWVLPIQPAAAIPLDELLAPVLLLAVAYFTINSWLIATAVAFEQRLSVVTIWTKTFLWLSLNYLGGASVALVLVNYTRNMNLAAVGLAVPLLVVFYLTLRTSWGRVEDANRHVVQLNDLYMSTIEALAMAVDAKDQITHGHIRRVQVFAVELAKRLGVADEQQLKGIATAALLHDMGKLAIPEHILNKPAKLTGAEFQKMKRHADIGADLLSSVKFPYPVVPIVRHHHEHWDGTGYPSGISGTDIPLGARILSIVDCFDALTSDRPYRPRLSTEDAFAIIREKRGTTYDPLLVDTFMRSYADIAPIAIQAGQEAHSIVNVADLAAPTENHPLASLQQIRASASEAALLKTFVPEMARAASPPAALYATAQCLRQLTPATVYALFVYDGGLDLLTCISAIGDEQRFLVGLNIKLGERVTGWVGANGRTSVNSDASLDLAQIAGCFTPQLRSTISTPLVERGTLVGVLTAYAIQTEAFAESHQYTFESLASSFASRVHAFQSSTSSNVLWFRTQKS